MSCSGTITKVGVDFLNFSEKSMAKYKKTAGELLCWWDTQEPAAEGQPCPQAH